MKSAWFGFCLCFVILQGCAQQKSEQAGNADQKPVTATTASVPAGMQAQQPQQMTAEQMKNIPKSQLYFMQSKTALEQNKSQECFDLLDKAVVAAKEEKNTSAAILCNETKARLKVAQKDNAGAVKILETAVKDFDLPNMDINTSARLDQSKALLASIYAINKSPDKADALYKTNLDKARSAKPVNHLRVAFWMRNYADFYKFKKNDKESQALQKAAAAELALDPTTAIRQALPGGAPAPKASKK